jgi:PAS domain S-box-containing protein
MKFDGVMKPDVTELSALKSQVKALDEENYLLRAILDGIRDSVFAKSRDGRYIFVNRAAAFLLGKTSDQMIGKDDVELFGAGQADAIRKEDQNILELDLNKIYEQKLSIQGKTHIFQTNKAPLKSAAGEIVGILGASADVTSERVAENALRESRNQLALIYNTTRELINLIRVEPNDTFRIISVNRAGIEVPGWRPDQILNKTIQELEFTDSQIKIIQQRLSETVKKSEATQTEDYFDSPNGLITIEGTLLPIFDSVGTCTHILSVARDISEQKREQRRQETLSKISKILLKSLDASQILNEVAKLIASELADYCIIFLTGEDELPIFLKASHRDPKREKELGELYRDHFSGADDIITGLVMKTGEAHLNDDVTPEQVRESVADQKRQEYWIQAGLRASLSVPLNIRGQVLGVIHFLSTDRFRRYRRRDLEFAEELCSRVALAIENSFLYNDAQNAIRLREEFLLVVSHELRTPLTSTVLNIQTLERAFNTGRFSKDSFLKLIHTARQQIDRLVRLANNMLTAAQMTRGELMLHLEKVDLLKLVHEVGDEFQDQLDKLKCTIEISSRGPTTGIWDSRRLKEVLSQLLSNAIKFGPGKPIRITLSGEDGQVEVCVQDFGIGISAEDQKRIFGPFERAVSPLHFGGLGIGLFISNEIIKAHGGSTLVESEAGKGSRFIFRLPVALPRPTRY